MASPACPTAALRSLHPDVLSGGEYGLRRLMWRADLQARLAAVNRREDEAWARVHTVADWEPFRDTRLAALRESLAIPTGPAAKGSPAFRETGRLSGAGFALSRIVYETHPGIVVSALLYRPDPPRVDMPAIQICHSHHRPKDQGELQDMGVNWARSGTAVLIPDLVGHGERREDPFGERQGYYSRYYSAMQLALVGESLAGWMIRDILCGNDLLLELPGVDPARLILVGAVAGGGDLAAIATALDVRVTGSIPFNFGSGSAWNPDCGGPLPPGVNLAGWGYWETTRNLRLSARDGFMPWLIVAAAAPRRLIYAHEFAWDPGADPAWERIRAVYDLYGVPENLAWMKGAGRCAPGDGNTHCTNVGPIHRDGIYPWLEKWFGMPPPVPEVQDRRPAAEIACKDASAQTRSVPLRAYARHRAESALATLRREGAALSHPGRRRLLQDHWRSLIGEGSPSGAADSRETTRIGEAEAHKLLIQSEGSIRIPTLLLNPAAAPTPPPLVIALAQQGKPLFLERQANALGHLVEAGIAVCLPDLRGMGEIRPDDMHGLQSLNIDCSEDERMLGHTALGRQFTDLQAVLRHIEARPDIDSQRLAIWGESLAPPNLPGAAAREHDSRHIDNTLRPNLPCGPAIGEPAGPALALLAGLLDDRVQAVLCRRGLVSWLALFDSFFFNMPSDIVIPHSIASGDFDDLAATLAPRPLRIESPVDSGNALIPAAELPAFYPLTLAAYADRADRFQLSATLTDDPSPWLIQALKRSP